MGGETRPCFFVPSIQGASERRNSGPVTHYFHQPFPDLIFQLPCVFLCTRETPPTDRGPTVCFLFRLPAPCSRDHNDRRFDRLFCFPGGAVQNSQRKIRMAESRLRFVSRGHAIPSARSKPHASAGSFCANGVCNPNRHLCQPFRYLPPPAAQTRHTPPLDHIPATVLHVMRNDPGKPARYCDFPRATARQYARFNPESSSTAGHDLQLLHRAHVGRRHRDALHCSSCLCRKYVQSRSHAGDA